MTTGDRRDLEVELLHCCENYGPWAVLYEVAKVLKPEFLKLQASEQKPSRRAARVVEALDDAEDAALAAEAKERR